jgi:hypothetical protein
MPLPEVDEVRWYRFFHDTLDDEAWQTLSPEAFKLAVNLLSFASSREGALRGELPNLKSCAFRLRMPLAELERLLPELLEAQIVGTQGDVPYLLDADRCFRATDDVAARVAAHRARKRAEADVTLHETSPVTASNGFSNGNVTLERRGEGEERRGEAAKPPPLDNHQGGGGNGTALVPSTSLGLSLQPEEMQVWEAFDIARGAVTARASDRVKERRLAACQRAITLGIGPTDIVQAAASAPAANKGMGEDDLLNTVLGLRGQHHLQSSRGNSTNGRPGTMTKHTGALADYQRMQRERT